MNRLEQEVAALKRIAAFHREEVAAPVKAEPRVVMDFDGFKRVVFDQPVGRAFYELTYEWTKVEQ